MTTPEVGVVRYPVRAPPPRSHTRKENPAQHDDEEEEEEEETEDEDTEGGEEGCYEGLTLEQLFSISVKIADPKCTITKLE